MEALLAVIIILLIVVAGAYLYKKRVSVAKWLNDPDMVEDKTQKRRRLERHIEDCQYKLEMLAKDDKED